VESAILKNRVGHRAVKREVTEVTKKVATDSASYLDCAAPNSEGRGYLNWAEVDLFPEETADAVRRCRARIQSESYSERVWQWILNRAERVPRAYIFFEEFRNFLQRIKIEPAPDSDDYSAEYGPFWEHDALGNPVPCRYTQTRMRDIEKAFANRGWGTLLDEVLYLEAWDEGLKFALHNPGFCTALANSNISYILREKLLGEAYPK
jgi:hypothetical protein